MDAVERLYLFSDASRGDYDVAAANLMAAVGLRGAEDLDVGYVLTWLDRAAKAIRLETLRQSYQFHERPQDFERSPAYFCMLVLATVLCKDFGVRYNPARIRDPKFQDPHCFDPDFSDSRDLFIHGLVSGPGGTCASMPVLYAAVGRRLGYPLKLVLAKDHLFVRWDDPSGELWSPGARFNIEATGNGLSCLPDSHYVNWPLPIEDKELALGIYMRALSPREEAAMFRSTRGICQWENGRYAKALTECHLAVMLAPHDQRYSWQVMDFYKKYRAIMASMTPEEIQVAAMAGEDEIELQKNIVRGHHERLQRGLPGYNLAEYGIYPKALPRDVYWPSLNGNRTLGPFEAGRPFEPAMLGSQARCTMTADSGMRPPPGTRAAVENLDRVKRQNEVNRRNQDRLRRGLPGLDPKDVGR